MKMKDEVYSTHIKPGASAPFSSGLKKQIKSGGHERFHLLKKVKPFFHPTGIDQ